MSQLTILNEYDPLTVGRRRTAGSRETLLETLKSIRLVDFDDGPGVQHAALSKSAIRRTTSHI
jgi:hypothetical protein